MCDSLVVRMSGAFLKFGDKSLHPALFYCLDKTKIPSSDWLFTFILVGKTSWSKDAVNGTHQNSKWKFPWDARVPFTK